MITIPEIKVETTQTLYRGTKVRAWTVDPTTKIRHEVQTYVPGASLLQSHRDLIHDVQAAAVADLTKFFLDQQA